MSHIFRPSKKWLKRRALKKKRLEQSDTLQDYEELKTLLNTLPDGPPESDSSWQDKVLKAAKAESQQPITSEAGTYLQVRQCCVRSNHRIPNGVGQCLCGLYQTEPAL